MKRNSADGLFMKGSVNPGTSYYFLLKPVWCLRIPGFQKKESLEPYTDISLLALFPRPQLVYRNDHPLPLGIIPKPLQSRVKNIHLGNIRPFSRGKLNTIIVLLLAFAIKINRAFARPLKFDRATKNISIPKTKCQAANPPRFGGRKFSFFKLPIFI